MRAKTCKAVIEAHDKKDVSSWPKNGLITAMAVTVYGRSSSKTIPEFKKFLPQVTAAIQWRHGLLIPAVNPAFDKTKFVETYVGLFELGKEICAGPNNLILGSRIAMTLTLDDDRKLRTTITTHPCNKKTGKLTKMHMARTCVEDG